MHTVLNNNTVFFFPSHKIQFNLLLLVFYLLDVMCGRHVPCSCRVVVVRVLECFFVSCAFKLFNDLILLNHSIYILLTLACSC
jgi:hypothetical protein